MKFSFTVPSIENVNKQKFSNIVSWENKFRIQFSQGPTGGKIGERRARKYLRTRIHACRVSRVACPYVKRFSRALGQFHLSDLRKKITGRSVA